MVGIIGVITCPALATTLQPWEAVKSDPLMRAMEEDLAKRPQVDFPLTHNFINGPDGKPFFYIRTIFMPADMEITTKIHKTRHPFWITKGKVGVYQAGGGMEILEAGHIGITEPGTWRALHIYEDTIWTTFHATELTDPKAVVDSITEPHDVPELTYKKEPQALAEAGL